MKRFLPNVRKVRVNAKQRARIATGLACLGFAPNQYSGSPNFDTHILSRMAFFQVASVLKQKIRSATGNRSQ